MKKILVSFGDSRMKLQSERLQRQAEEMNIYDKIYICNENDLSSDFCEKYAKELVFGSRGFGYWCWKPQIIHQILQKMQDGDILQYIDIGCHLNPKGRERLEQYFAITETAPSGILVFSNTSYEYSFSKGDLLDYLEVRNRADIVYTPQIEAGVCFIKKCNKTMELVQKWLDVIATDFALINDTPSKTPNLNGFIEHRHDQSIFSILVKKQGCCMCPNYELLNFRNKKSTFPIESRRDTAIYKTLKEQKISRMKHKLFMGMINIISVLIPNRKLRHHFKIKYKKKRV